MKLIQAWPKPEINTLDNPLLDSDEDEDRAISAMVGFSVELLKGLINSVWRVAYVEDHISSGLVKGDIVGREALGQVLRNCLEGNQFVVLRDGSCRFVQPGQDYYMSFGLKHGDEVPNPDKHRVKAEDRSALLIETDFFDI